MMRRAILLSGGLDSTALAALERPESAFVIDYGQVCAQAEIAASRAVAAALDIPITIIAADCASVGSGDLSRSPALAGIAPSSEWWPYRNQLLATLAAPVAIRNGVTEMLFATVRTDSFHADGTPEFFAALDALLRLQEGGMRVAAPVARWSSQELIQRAGVGHDLLGWTHSCHTGNAPCGACRGCRKHLSIMADIGLWP